MPTETAKSKFDLGSIHCKVVHNREQVPDSGTLSLLDKEGKNGGKCAYIAIVSHFGRSLLIDRKTLTPLTATHSDRHHSWRADDAILFSATNGPVTDFC